MRIILLFKSYGPYHLARLRALRVHHDVLALEFTAVDEEYNWDVGTLKTQAEVRALAASAANLRDFTARLHEQCLAYAPDAVAIPGWGEFFALSALAVAKSLGLPTVLMSDSRFEDAPRCESVERFKAAIVSLFDAAFVAGTQHRAYLTNLGMADELIRDGYDVIDNAHFAAQELSGAVRPEGVSRPYLLCCARLVAKKNLAFLLRAFALFKAADHEDWSLAIVGEGPEHPTLRCEIDVLGLRRHVQLLGKKGYAELPALYRHCEALILPSLTDQWGLVVNEAMACGRAVLVSTGAGCAPDLVVDGVNGYTFSPDDAKQLTARLIDIASGDREAMGRESARIVADWDLGRFVSGLTACCEIARLRRTSRARGLTGFLTKSIARAVVAGMKE